MAVFKKKKPQNDESRYMASQWKLMWIKLKKHKLAKFSMIVLAVLYFGALFADFLAPYGLEDFTGLYKDTAPTTFRYYYDMWQYSSSGAVDGIEGNVDMNISYLGID